MKNEDENKKVKTAKGIIKHRTNNRRPLPVFNRNREYDFLTYYRVVEKWATENYKLTRGQFHLVLFLYKMTIFTRNQLANYHKTIGLYPQKTLAKFIEEGWITEWYGDQNKKYTQYVLTQKARMFCARVHRMCVGDEEIPYKANLMADSTKKVNDYYMDLIDQCNRETEEKRDKRL